MWRHRGAGTTSARDGSHVPHGGVGAQAQRGTACWSWCPPDAKLDSGTELFHRADLGCCTDSQHFLPFSHLSEHLWTMGTCAAPMLPALCHSQNLPAPSGCRAGGTCGIWWPGSPWGWSLLPCHTAPPRPPLPLRHGAMVPSPDPHAAPGQPGELLSPQCALSQSQGPKRPFKGCLGMSPMATPHSSESAACTCSLPTGTSPPSRTERSVAIPSPAKKRTTLVSAVGWGHDGCGGQPVPMCLLWYGGR